MKLRRYKSLLRLLLFASMAVTSSVNSSGMGIEAGGLQQMYRGGSIVELGLRMKVARRRTDAKGKSCHILQVLPPYTIVYNRFQRIISTQKRSVLEEYMLAFHS